MCPPTWRLRAARAWTPDRVQSVPNYTGTETSGSLQLVHTAMARKPFSSGVVYWDIYFVKHITLEMVEGLIPNSNWLCTIASAVTLACGYSRDQSHVAFLWWILWPTSEWKNKGEIWTLYLYSPHLWCLPSLHSHIMCDFLDTDLTLFPFQCPLMALHRPLATWIRSPSIPYEMWWRLTSRLASRAMSFVLRTRLALPHEPMVRNSQGWIFFQLPTSSESSSLLSTSMSPIMEVELSGVTWGNQFFRGKCIDFKNCTFILQEWNLNRSLPFFAGELNNRSRNQACFFSVLRGFSFCSQV